MRSNASTPHDTGREIVANLDGELELARCFLPSSASRPSLPEKVVRGISAAATLLRAFAAEGDRLWTPAAVAPSRLAAVSGLAHPRLASGPLEEQPPPQETLAWMETPRLAARRSLTRPLSAARRDTEEREAGLLLLCGKLWGMPPPEPKAVATVNHRGLCLRIASSLGLALPGARLVQSVPELEEHLARGATRSSSDRWVLKAPYSAAARSRVLGHGFALGDSRSRRQAERLFARYSELLFEPWMARLRDFGCSGIVEDQDRVLILGIHAIEVTTGGQFRGITLALEKGPPDLTGAESRLFADAARSAGQQLGRLGYRGPFGVDGWRYRDTSGEMRFHPLGEINGRLTFGLVARALAERLEARLGLEPATRLRLRLGRGDPPATRPGATVVPLLYPEAGEPTSAWLEILNT